MPEALAAVLSNVTMITVELESQIGVVEATDLSQGCAQCYGDVTGCTTSNCALGSGSASPAARKTGILSAY